MHCYYFDAGLGDIHDIKTKEYPRGLTGSWGNEYNWKFYLKKLEKNNMKEKMTKEEINKLCLLTFKRPMDKKMESYVGHSFDFVADEWLKSNEHKIFTPLYKAGKDIEKFGKQI
jgi:Zn-finger domain-containing protein